MASKSLLFWAIIVVCVSRILPIEGKELSKHSHAEHKFEVGSLFTDGQKSNKSAVNTTRSTLIGAASGYTQVAGYQSKGESGNMWWHGVRANIDVWKLDVQPLSYSATYIAAINNYNGEEIIAAGVHVYPQMHKNNDLRFFTYWRTSKDRGCYNTYCPGFVIANDANLFPGQALAPPFSTYGGERRYITLKIKKDERTGDWSLYREDQGGPIGGMTLTGWWPKGLFKDLSDRANIIQWAGEVNYQKNETGPSMGSGHFPFEGKGKSAAFYDCFGINSDGKINKGSTIPIPFVSLPECYHISSWYHTGRPGYQHFFYGGPGGCTL